MKPSVAILLLFFTASVSVFADDLTFDNSNTIPMSNKGGEAYADTAYSFDAYKQAVSKTGSNGFIAAVLANPPLGFNGYLDEYRANGGGPVSNFFGIAPFKLQNALVRSFTGLMLLIFVGAAILTGLHRVSTGQGDLNFVNIGLKFIFGLLVIFHPDFIYAAGRTIQTGSMYAISVTVAGLGDSFAETLKKTDPLNNSYKNVINNALDSQKAKLANYLAYGTAAQCAAELQAYNASLANVTPPLPQVEIPALTGDEGNADIASSSLKTAWNNFQHAVGGNKDFQEQTAPLIQEYIQAIANGEEPITAQNAFQNKVEVIASKVGRQTYAIVVPKGQEALVGANLQSGTTKLNATALMSGTWLGNVFIPLIAWVVLRISQLALEWGVVIIVFTYPLWFLDATKKAFLGAWNSLFTTAVLPAVAILLLAVFEGIMSQLQHYLNGGDIPTGIWWLGAIGSQLIYICAWIVGSLIILWQSKKVTKHIMEGTSPIGSMMGGMIAGAAGTALMAAGIPAVAGAAPMAAGAKAAGGLAMEGGKAGLGAAVEGGKAAVSAFKGMGSAGKVGASSYGGSGGGGSDGPSLPELASAGSASTLGSTKQATAASNTGDRIAQKRLQKMPGNAGQPPASRAGAPSVGSVAGTPPVASASMPGTPPPVPAVDSGSVASVSTPAGGVAGGSGPSVSVPSGSNPVSSGLSAAIPGGRVSTSKIPDTGAPIDTRKPSKTSSGRPPKSNMDRMVERAKIMSKVGMAAHRYTEQYNKEGRIL